MPIYEYQCTSCQHHFDLMQKISDDPVKECPVCHQNTIIKLISAAGFQLKGSGWYVTDFKNKSNKPEASKNDDSAKKVDTAKAKEATSSSAGSQNGDQK